MKRVIPGQTLCEGWTWVDASGEPPTVAGELFTDRSGAIHQAEGTQEQVVYVRVVAGASRRERPRVSAIGYMLIISPDEGGRYRVEFVSRAGNLHGYTVCNSKAEAIKHRRELFRLHAKLAKERAERKARNQTRVEYFYDHQGDWTLYRISRPGGQLRVDFRSAGGWQPSNFPAAMVRCFRTATKAEIRKIGAEEEGQRGPMGRGGGKGPGGDSRGRAGD